MEIIMLELDDLVKQYSDFRLGPVNMTVKDEVLAVLGPSGCGKTTLLSMIAGICLPDEGTIRLDGRILDGLASEDRNVSLLFQDGALFPHMTARENIAYAATSPNIITELAMSLEITDILHKLPNGLSGGEKQRVALARALAADPAALLLDEPLTNLDAPIKNRLRGELRSFLADLDIPVLYVTHDQQDASVLGDRIVVMRDGTVRQAGTPKEVFERPASSFVATFTGNPNQFRALVRECESATQLDWESYTIEMGADSAVSPGDDVVFCVRPEQIRLSGDAENDPEENVIPCKLIRQHFAGNSYWVTVRPDGTDHEVMVHLSPMVYKQYNIDNRDRICISLPKMAIHLWKTQC